MLQVTLTIFQLMLHVTLNLIYSRVFSTNVTLNKLPRSVTVRLRKRLRYINRQISFVKVI